MPVPRSTWIPVSLLVAGLLGLWWWRSGPVEKTASPSTRGGAETHSNRAAPVLENPLVSTFGLLRDNPQKSEMLRSLNELQDKLKAMPSGEAIAWIRSFLDGGKDKPTGLSFEINKDGSLKEWPTFRTFLLDALATIDPAAAAQISREILAAPTTADEWSLALRNVGRSGESPDSRDFLREKTEELIQNPAWQADPSIGYLNAFDVLVHTHATESTPLLSSLIQKKDRKDLAHAGFLTLDRLVQREPTDVLTRLAADRSLQQSRPEMIAQQFARADLRDPAQRQIVKRWLLDPARTGTELNSFSGVFPNNNRFVSNNLLTSETQQSGGDLSTHDREVREIIASWNTEPEFQPVASYLQIMLKRLESFAAGSSADSIHPIRR